MRTTIRMDPHLARQVKEYAARHGLTVTRLIEDALRERLAREHTGRVRATPALPTFRGKGLKPGIDLDDSAHLLDLMGGG